MSGRSSFARFVRATAITTAMPQVLLKREVPIDREKRLEVLGNHKLQEFTVALGRPTQINDVMCVVAGQITQQRPGHTLIEQQSHAPRSLCAPVQEPQLLARD
jgi:hypothetical protein